MSCRHPPAARISYGDRAAPLGREGDEHCDVCGERVDPEAMLPEVRVHDVHGQEVETWRSLEGWFWQASRRVPQYLPYGPFLTEDDALEDAASDLALPFWQAHRCVPRLTDMRPLPTDDVRATNSRGEIAISCFAGSFAAVVLIMALAVLLAGGG